VTLTSYGADHAQGHIRSYSQICSRLNNYQKKGVAPVSLASITEAHSGMDASEKTGATPFFLVIIRPRANPCVQANAALHMICTVCNWFKNSLRNEKDSERATYKRQSLHTCVSRGHYLVSGIVS